MIKRYTLGKEYNQFHEHPQGELVFYSDYKEMSEYADKLAQGLPCLPKDIENLREANLNFAMENQRLESRIRELEAALAQANSRVTEVYQHPINKDIQYQYTFDRDDATRQYQDFH